MTRRWNWALLVASGLLAGVLAAVLPQGWGDGDGPTTTVASSTTTTVPETPREVWLSPYETRIGPAVVIPTAATLGGAELEVTYDVEPIGPASAAAEGIPAAAEALAGPGDWTLTAGGTTYRSASLSPTNRSVRFAVGEGFLLESIEELRIDSYFAMFPIYIPWDVDSEDREWAMLGPGLRLRLVDVTEQPNNYLVRVETDLPTALLGEMSVEGRGRDFLNSSVSMIDLPRWTIDYRVAELPEEIPLVARGLMWIELHADAPVTLEGLEE